MTVISKRKEAEKQAKKEAELQAKEQAKREAEEAKKRKEAEEKAKKEAELQAKEQAKREAEEAKKRKEAKVNMRGVSRPLWTQPKLLLPIAVVIILAVIGYGIWLSQNIIDMMMP